MVKYPNCRTCDWRSGTTNSLFCSFPWWICDKSLGGSFAPKCSWCLECVNFRCHVQICSYTILTAKITQLIKLLSLGYTASRYTTQHFLRICSDNLWREWLLHHCSCWWGKPHLTTTFPAFTFEAFNNMILLLKICFVAECKRTNLSGLWLRLFLQAGFPGWEDRNTI